MTTSITNGYSNQQVNHNIHMPEGSLQYTRLEILPSIPPDDKNLPAESDLMPGGSVNSPGESHYGIVNSMYGVKRPYPYAP